MDAAASSSTSATADAEPKTRKPPKSLDRLVGVWKRAHVGFKKLEARVDDARDVITKLLLGAGFKTGDHFETAHGKFSLQTKATTNWEGLARKHIAAAVIEQELALFTSSSKPFIRAPASWSGEARK